MSMPGGMEWIVILAVVILLFGAKKIPAVAEGLGKGIQNFKKAMKSGENESLKAEMKDEKIEEKKA